jgi:hypothetical protein
VRLVKRSVEESHPQPFAGAAILMNNADQPLVEEAKSAKEASP